MKTPAEYNAIEWEGAPLPSYDNISATPAPLGDFDDADPNVEILTLSASLDAAIDRADAAHDALAEARQRIGELEAALERTQVWLTETSAELMRYKAKYGPMFW